MPFINVKMVEGRTSEQKNSWWRPSHSRWSIFATPPQNRPWSSLKILPKITGPKVGWCWQIDWRPKSQTNLPHLSIQWEHAFTTPKPLQSKWLVIWFLSHATFSFLNDSFILFGPHFSRWCSKWSDLAELTAEPEITDEEAYQVCVEALEARKWINLTLGTTFCAGDGFSLSD